MSVVINTCQKVCAELTNPTGTPPYFWIPDNTNVVVTRSGTGINAIISGNSAGNVTVTVSDSLEAIIATFSFTVVNHYEYVTSVTSNTVYLASTVLNASATSSGSVGTFSGPFASLSTTGNGNNTVWFSFCSSSASNFSGVTTVVWDRSIPANTITVSHDTITNIDLSIIGIGITSITPAFNAIDYQVPIVQYISATQSSSFSSLITLPYELPCGDLNSYAVFAQKNNVTAGLGRVVAATLQSGSLLKVGYSESLVNYQVSYVVAAVGTRNPTGSFLRYCGMDQATISSPNGFIDITLDTAIALGNSTLWLACFRPDTISNVSAFIFRVVAAYQTTTTNLRIVYSSSSAGSTTVMVAYMGFFNQNTGGISLVEN